MKKALKYILILLLCAAIGLGVSASIHSGIQRAEIENTYIASYPQAIELPKKQGKEILKGNYSPRNWEVRFNGTRNAYFWYRGDVYYTFENAPGILLRVQWDSWNCSMQGNMLVAEDVHLPDLQTDTAKQVMGYTGEFPMVSGFDTFPPMQNLLQPLELNEEAIKLLQNIVFTDFSQQNEVLPLPETEWACYANGDLKVLNLHWQFQEEPYLWQNAGALIQNKNGEVFYAQNPYLSASMGWWAYDIQPIPEPAQSELQNAFREINF